MHLKNEKIIYRSNLLHRVWQKKKWTQVLQKDKILFLKSSDICFFKWLQTKTQPINLYSTDVIKKKKNTYLFHGNNQRDICATVNGRYAWSLNANNVHGYDEKILNRKSHDNNFIFRAQNINGQNT